MQTAIKQMIEAWLQYQVESKSDSITIEKLIEVAEAEYIPLEKEQIKNAFTEGFCFEGKIDSEEFYRRNYEK